MWSTCVAFSFRRSLNGVGFVNCSRYMEGGDCDSSNHERWRRCEWESGASSPSPPPAAAPPSPEPSTNLFVSGEPLVLPFLSAFSSFLSSLLLSFLLCVSRASSAVADHINWRKALPLIPIGTQVSYSIQCLSCCVLAWLFICFS